MIPKAVLQIRKPLFFKLAVIFMITSLAVISAVASYLVLSFPHGPRGSRGNMHSNMLFHVNDLADKIGTPPNHARAASLANQLGLKIRIEGPNGIWSSSEDMAPTENFLVRVHGNPPGGAKSGRMDDGFFMLLPRDPYRFLFLFPGNPDFSIPLRSSLILLTLLVIILFMSYATVSWLIKPLLKAKERLLVDVSHELRSPLTRIKVALEMVPKSANQKSISRAVSEMEAMLHEILESERMKSSHGALSLSNLNLVKLTGHLVDTYKEQAPGLKILKPESFPILKLDEAKIKTVLKNVMENSLKYSRDQKRSVELRFMDDKKSASIKIKDFGIGIPKEDLRLVFEPFYRVDKSRTKKTGGYGLGLSLCREIMQAHGGKITLESRPGSGTEITLLFPKKSIL